jgi:hypothetical protein
MLNNMTLLLVITTKFLVAIFCKVPNFHATITL